MDGPHVPIEVSKMYPIRVDTDLSLRGDRNLREYARLEYGEAYAGWIAFEAHREVARERRRWGWFSRSCRPTLRAMPHKGTPRGLESGEGARA